MTALALIPAAYVYLRRGGEVLLQLRQNTGFMDGNWSAGAAGHLEAGETAERAARRELSEELGVAAQEGALAPAMVMQRTDGTDNPVEQRVDWFFVCDRWRGQPTIQEPRKCVDLEWFRLDNLPVLLPEHERVALTTIRERRMPTVGSFGFRDD